MDLLYQRLAAFQDRETASCLAQLQHGIEKESLRIDAQGVLSQLPHPAALGAPLTQASITTDFSESLLELITPPSTDIRQTLRVLTELHHFVYQNIGDEKLWVNSMPCVLLGEHNIPIARYGQSNTGRMKYIYRRGLAMRYGRLMQTIAGIHYNISLPKAFWHVLSQIEHGHEADQNTISAGYFATIRNIHRHSWLLLLLMGASPAVCMTFLEGRKHDLDALDEHSFGLPYATSLRMSDLGYQNNAQSGIDVSYDGLERYVETLNQAMMQVYPAYTDMGVLAQGEYLQLNDHTLQVENEFYSMVRPKRAGDSSVRPTRLLKEFGVEYLELRFLDLNPFAAIGIDIDQTRMLDIFVVFCALQYSPPICTREQQEIVENRQRTVLRGRQPGLALSIQGAKKPLVEQGHSLLQAMAPIAELLDHACQTSDFSVAIKQYRHTLDDLSLTPSARILKEMQSNGEAFAHFARRKAAEHERWFKMHMIDPVVAATLQQQAQTSQQELLQLEQEQSNDFAGFLACYLGTSTA